MRWDVSRYIGPTTDVIIILTLANVRDPAIDRSHRRVVGDCEQDLADDGTMASCFSSMVYPTLKGSMNADRKHNFHCLLGSLSLHSPFSAHSQPLIES